VVATGRLMKTSEMFMMAPGGARALPCQRRRLAKRIFSQIAEARPPPLHGHLTVEVATPYPRAARMGSLGKPKAQLAYPGLLKSVASRVGFATVDID
jgi:hypothetical protein